MHTITLSRDNVVENGRNDTLLYEFQGGQDMTHTEVALSSLYMYYSWENINAAPLANNKFSFIWPAITEDGNGNAIGPFGPTKFDVVIPDGQYEIRDINTFLQNFCIDNDLYLKDTATGQFVYFLQIQINPTQYKIQFNSYSLPSDFASISAQYTQPPNGFGSSITGVPAAGGFPGSTGGPFAPGWFFPSKFSEFVGQPDNKFYPNQLPTPYDVFSPTSLPAALRPSGAFPTGSVSFLSTKTPQVNPNPVIYLQCSLINNPLANPTSFLAPVPGKTALGDLLIQEPPEFAFAQCSPGAPTSFTLRFTDVQGSPIKLLDPNITITLIFRRPPSHEIGADLTGGLPAGRHALRDMQHPKYHSDQPHASATRAFHAKRYS